MNVWCKTNMLLVYCISVKQISKLVVEKFAFLIVFLVCKEYYFVKLVSCLPFIIANINNSLLEAISIDYNPAINFLAQKGTFSRYKQGIENIFCPHFQNVSWNHFWGSSDIYRFENIKMPSQSLFRHHWFYITSRQQTGSGNTAV